MPIELHSVLCFTPNDLTIVFLFVLLIGTGVAPLSQWNDTILDIHVVLESEISIACQFLLNDLLIYADFLLPPEISVA